MTEIDRRLDAALRYAAPLSVLALPLWVPLVLAGGRAVQVAMAGGSPGADQALPRLLAISILFVVTASLAARFVLDD